MTTEKSMTFPVQNSSWHWMAGHSYFDLARIRHGSLDIHLPEDYWSVWMVSTKLDQFTSTLTYLNLNQKSVIEINHGARTWSTQITMCLRQSEDKISREQDKLVLEDEGFHDFACIILCVCLVSSIQCILYLHNWYMIP